MYKKWKMRERKLKLKLICTIKMIKLLFTIKKLKENTQGLHNNIEVQVKELLKINQLKTIGLLYARQMQRNAFDKEKKTTNDPSHGSEANKTRTIMELTTIQGALQV